MAIPESQLKTWSHEGASATSAVAYNSIRNALLASQSPLATKRVEIFLQGSYANSTNIYGDSDVDVVVLYDDTFFKDLTALTSAQQQLHARLFPPATYHWDELRDDVLAALRAYYGRDAVTLGRKSIKVVTARGRRPSDVIPAVQFRRYATFTDQNAFTAHWGIQFFDSQNNAIVNYPKYHIERGQDKNKDSRTRGLYKPTIRLFKNFRNYLVDRGMLGQSVAPSYFVECALHNAPDNLFLGEFSSTVPAILRYLSAAEPTALMCQNGVTGLIGSEPTQWNIANFVSFVSAVHGGWQNY